MTAIASVNGELLDAREARVSVLDNGFVFGESAYEVMRTYGARPFALGRHLARLRRSAGRLGIEIPLSDAALQAQVQAALKRAANEESYIRIIVTRGVGDMSYHLDAVSGPTVVVVVKPFEAFPERCWSEGIAVTLSSFQRNSPRALDPAIKSSNLLNNAFAVREAYSKGSVEAILLNAAGEVAEGASSNVFLARHGALRTPPLSAGLLAGITREVVLELAAALGLACSEQPLERQDLLGADELFMTSTLKEVMPVVRVDEKRIGAGVPGPVTLELLAAYRTRAREAGD